MPDNFESSFAILGQQSLLNRTVHDSKWRCKTTLSMILQFSFSGHFSPCAFSLWKFLMNDSYGQFFLNICDSSVFTEHTSPIFSILCISEHQPPSLRSPEKSPQFPLCFLSILLILLILFILQIRRLKRETTRIYPESEFQTARQKAYCQ